MDSKFDYRALEARAKVLQDRVLEIGEKDEPTPQEHDEVVGLMGEIHALEDTAGQMKEAELVELRAVVANGTKIPGEPTVEDQEVADFHHYLKTGEIRNTALSSTSANGGYIVPEPTYATLIQKLRKIDPIFGRATVFEMKGNTTLMLPYKAAHGVVTTATETGARSEQTEPTFTSPTLVCYDYYSDQRASQQFIDSVTDAESMLLEWMAEDIQEQAGADAVAGTGSTCIEGIFHGTTKFTTQFSGAAATVLNTSPIKLYFGLPIAYRPNAAWVMESSTLSTLVGFANPSNANLPLCTIDANDKWSMYGKPILESNSAPVQGAGNYVIGFGDITQSYAVGIHRETSILRDPFTCPPLIRYYSLARLGGTPWNYQSFQIMRCATV